MEIHLRDERAGRSVGCDQRRNESIRHMEVREGLL
jgi:hypothetical protein